jgi:lipopolysaccharide export LptBFGC system permease protein LptF
MKMSLTVAAFTIAAFATPAFAGTPVPGPLLGVGAPALALFAGGYYLIRKRRRG